MSTMEKGRTLFRGRALHTLCVAVLLLTGCVGTDNRSNSNANRESLATPTPTPVPQPESPASESSLVALSAGAYVVKRPSEWMDQNSAYELLDENPATYWAAQRGVTSPQTIVIALAERTLLKTVEFSNATTDIQFAGCSAKDISVEMSDTSGDDGFQRIAEVSLKDRADNQRFPVLAVVPGRWVRLTVKNNHSSDPDNTIELDEFRAYGDQLTHTPLPDVSGTYNFYFTGDFHLKQQGTSVIGCYESRHGTIEGGIEGHICKFTYYELFGGQEHQEQGSAIIVFATDGTQAMGLWREKNSGLARLVIGPKKGSEVGACAHWAGGVEEQLTRDLEESGRARVYGINFDIDSDRIKDESKPTLEKIASILRAKPDWKPTVEGHTDSTSTPQHNQDLSEKRAASVKNYLESAGIESSRLKTIGYGATRPVASNDTEFGRAQNRRVELTR